MSYTVVRVTCPACAAAVGIDDEKCSYCGSPLFVSVFNSIYDMPLAGVKTLLDTCTDMREYEQELPRISNTAAMCYMKLRLFDKALGEFEKAISYNFNSSETYFYAALCVLDGRKAFLLNRNKIDMLESYIRSALAIEPRGIYYYFWAYIKFDYYERKFLNTAPDFKECLRYAEAHKVSEYDKRLLFDVIGVERPKGF